ncbi:hypothetical protein SLS61_009309 [Didymella pomorum]
MYTNAITLLALAGAAQAHMSLWYPGPLGGAKEANAASTDSNVDPELNFPLGCCDSNGDPTEPSPGICRGHLDLFDDEEPQVTWQPGQDAYFQLSDYTYTADAPGGTHYGGSCQVGFSTDKGKTWKVAASYNGNCPLRGEDGSPEVQTFDFKVPTGIPEGKALFGWIWLNREHESFMNCAAVQIGEGSGNTSTPTNPVAPSVSATKPSKPSSSSYQPSQPEEPQFSLAPQPTSTRAAGKPSYPTASASPSKPDDYSEKPSYDAPPEDDSEETDDSEDTEDSEENGDESEENNDDSQENTDDSEENTDDSEDDNKRTRPGYWHPNRHQSIKYKMIDEHKCKIDTVAKRAECECKAISGCSSQKRALVERKAVRMVRRDAFKKRTDGCAWDSAPSMVVSYYTVDAKCAPNAKMNVPESDTFEIGWSEPCGVVEGDGEYPVKEMDCSMFS